MTNNEKIIWDFLKAKGFNDFAIAGLMGNIYAESGLRPNNLQNTFEKKLGMTDEEYTSAVDNGSYDNFTNDKAGYGLAQWTFWTRKQNLLNYAKSVGKSIGDINMQLDFLYNELQGYKAVIDVLNNATSVKEASDAVLTGYEKPADQSDKVKEKRAGYGQTYYCKYATIETEKTESGDIMKYNETNKPIVCMQTNSTCYKGTREMTVKGVLWHSTGAKNPNLKRYVQPSDDAADKEEMINLLGKNQYGNDWNHIEREAGLNCWIGKLKDGTIATIQTMPWNYRPWGCGKGSKGSCNDGWVQFEICEDDLTNADYFNAVYKEAVEITAYICKMFNLDPKGTVEFNGVNVPVILCHADSHKLGLGSNHGDVWHWFNKFGKTMDDVRNDVAELLNAKVVVPAPKPEEPKVEEVKKYYRVRKTWEDAKSQTGAYAILDNAKAACGVGYTVYDWDGNVVYKNEPKPVLKSNEEIAKEVISGKWGNGQARKEALEKAGYDYNAVQSIVNELMKPKYRTHTVVKGDTLWDISKRYLSNGTRYPEIKSLNGLKNNVIHVGQVLKIPNK